MKLGPGRHHAHPGQDPPPDEAGTGRQADLLRRESRTVGSARAAPRGAHFMEATRHATWQIQPGTRPRGGADDDDGGAEDDADGSRWRRSPHERTEWTIDGAKLSIEYGRPSLKGRPEAQLMPPGQPWRTGADVATILTTDKPLKFGSLSVPAGSYTINTQPGARVAADPRQARRSETVGRALQTRARNRPRADEGRQDQGAGGAVDDRDRRHTRRRHPARRVGHDERVIRSRSASGPA